ncbi:MAG TPA: hypothetical protein VGF67_20585 [Ktedonobacteraceae bacterium]
MPEPRASVVTTVGQTAWALPRPGERWRCTLMRPRSSERAGFSPPPAALTSGPGNASCSPRSCPGHVPPLLASWTGIHRLLDPPGSLGRDDPVSGVPYARQMRLSGSFSAVGRRATDRSRSWDITTLPADNARSEQLLERNWGGVSNIAH